MFISILLPPLNPVSLDCNWNTVIKILNQYSHTCRIDMILAICSVVSKQKSKQYIIVILTIYIIEYITFNIIVTLHDATPH